MQAKEYQRLALERLDLYLEILEAKYGIAVKTEELRKQNPELEIPVIEFAEKTWEELVRRNEVGRAKSYSTREDGIGRVVPNITLKVPTGGGKTYLAVQAIARILDKHFGAVTGAMVLWIVPSEAIYRQTKAALTNQEHPLRKLLNIASGGRVKILEKDSPLHKDDVSANLCILLLMLPSANRQEAVSKLKMFRDRGNVNGFLPAEDDSPAHERLVRECPNLDYVVQSNIFGEPTEGVGMVRNSLGNVLRLLRPLVVMDEGHRGFSDLAHSTLYGFNPRFVLELSATPKDGQTRHSNWLIDIRGEALRQEEMIKFPIQLTVTPSDAWKTCLESAWEKIEELQGYADELRSNDNRYIRPILLVQVERTGDDKRTDDFIHALDVKEHLIHLGLAEDEIAIKSSEVDDLKDQDLLSPANRIRAIITKQALQEGWDCPFAYVLCALAQSRTANAMTQLVGRILRQPGAKRTGIEALDQSYVFTFRESTQNVIKRIQKGLEGEGMGDLATQVRDTGGTESASEALFRKRREAFRGKEFFLPKVLMMPGRREIDWETDILGRIDWNQLSIVDSARRVEKGADLTGGVYLVDFKDSKKLSRVGGSLETFDLEFAVRVLSDTVPNPWIAYRIIVEFLEALRGVGWTEEELAAQQSHLRTLIVKTVLEQIDVMARAAFESGLADGSIVFDLAAEPWWKVPHESVAVSKVLGGTFDKSLFEPIVEGEMNQLESTVATYLDSKEMVYWWYRNVVKGEGYGLQGWRRNRMYPDLIVALGSEVGINKWLVLETKGDHLAGSEDTAAKVALAEKLTSAYLTQQTQVIGQLTLFEQKAKYAIKMIQENDWKSGVDAELN